MEFGYMDPVFRLLATDQNEKVQATPFNFFLDYNFIGNKIPTDLLGIFIREIEIKLSSSKVYKQKSYLSFYRLRETHFLDKSKKNIYELPDFPQKDLLVDGLVKITPYNTQDFSLTFKVSKDDLIFEKYSETSIGFWILFQRKVSNQANRKTNLL